MLRQAQHDSVEFPFKKWLVTLSLSKGVRRAVREYFDTLSMTGSGNFKRWLACHPELVEGCVRRHDPLMLRQAQHDILTR